MRVTEWHFSYYPLDHPGLSTWWQLQGFQDQQERGKPRIEHFGCLCLQWPCSQHIGGCWLTQTQGVRNRFHLLIGAAAVSHTKSRCREGKIYDHFRHLPHCWKQRKQFSSVDYFIDSSILILWVCVGSVAQSHLTLCNSRACSTPGSSVCGTFQARKLVWIAISSGHDIADPRIEPASRIICTGRQILYHWAPWEALPCLSLAIVL